MSARTLLLLVILLFPLPIAAQTGEPLSVSLRYVRTDTLAGESGFTVSPFRFRPGLPEVPAPSGLTGGAEYAVFRFEEDADSLLVVRDTTAERLYAAAWHGSTLHDWSPALRVERGDPPVAVVEVDLHAGGASRRVAMQIVRFGDRFMFGTGDRREGTVRLDGRAYRVALVRGSRGLDFDDLDDTAFYLDLDGDGAFQGSGRVDSTGVYYPAEGFSAHQPFMLGGRPYEVAAVAPDGATLTLRPSDDTTALAVGFRAPDFAVETLAGETVHLSDFRDRLVVLNWWGTWCAPCLEEIPSLNELVARYDADRVAFLAIAEDGRTSVEAFLEEQSFDYLQALAGDDVRSLLGSPWPQHLIIDETGRIVFHESGGSADRGEDLDQVIRALLDEP